jgi:hypothetical protein
MRRAASRSRSGTPRCRRRHRTEASSGESSTEVRDAVPAARVPPRFVRLPQIPAPFEVPVPAPFTSLGRACEYAQANGEAVRLFTLSANVPPESRWAVERVLLASFRGEPVPRVVERIGIRNVLVHTPPTVAEVRNADSETDDSL